MNEYSDNFDSRLSRSESALQRASFVRKTYFNLALALVGFGLLEAFLLSWPPSLAIAQKMTQGSMWIVVMLLFIGASHIANKMSLSPTSRGIQYAGLTLFVIVEAIIFLPLMLVANAIAPGAIVQAGVMTGAMVAGLTCVAIFSKSDFSFLRSSIVMVSWLAMGLIVCAVLFSFELGTWFSLAMIALASASILYETGMIFKRYDTDQYVAASLGLFASVILLYFYILRMLLNSRR